VGRLYTKKELIARFARPGAVPTRPDLQRWARMLGGRLGPGTVSNAPHVHDVLAVPTLSPAAQKATIMAGGAAEIHALGGPLAPPVMGAPILAPGSSVWGGLSLLAVGATRLATRTAPGRAAIRKLTGRAVTAPPPMSLSGRAGLAATAVIGAVTAASAFEGTAALIERARETARPRNQLVPRTSTPAVRNGDRIMPHEGTGQSIELFREGHGGGFGMGTMPAGNAIVNSWTANGVPFVQAANGQIAVQRKNGTVKVYRPAKMIVVSRNPRIGTLLRAHKRIDKLMKGIQKRAPKARAPRSSKGIHHSRDI